MTYKVMIDQLFEVIEAETEKEAKSKLISKIHNMSIEELEKYFYLYTWELTNKEV